MALKPLFALAALPFALAACATTPAGPAMTPDGLLMELPEGVAAIAAPFQNLNAVRINPTTGCYEYRYAGVVENTFLPLRSTEGRPICTQLPEATA